MAANEIKYNFNQISHGIYMNDDKNIIVNKDGHIGAAVIGDTIDSKSGDIFYLTLILNRNAKFRSKDKSKDRKVGVTTVCYLDSIINETIPSNGETNFMVTDRGCQWNNIEYTRGPNFFGDYNTKIEIIVNNRDSTISFLSFYNRVKMPFVPTYSKFRLFAIIQPGDSIEINSC